MWKKNRKNGRKNLVKKKKGPKKNLKKKIWVKKKFG